MAAPIGKYTSSHFSGPPLAASVQFLRIEAFKIYLSTFFTIFCNAATRLATGATSTSNIAKTNNTAFRGLQNHLMVHINHCAIGSGG